MEYLYSTSYLHCNPGHVRGNGFRCLPEQSTVQGLIQSQGVLPCSTSRILCSAASFSGRSFYTRSPAIVCEEPPS